MAKIGDLKFNADIEVSDETAIRCCILLSMYMTDNPDKTFSLSEIIRNDFLERNVKIIDRKDGGVSWQSVDI